MAENRPKVGVAALIYKQGTQSFLFGKRKGSHGDGTWQLPGGHLEYGEDWAETASREVEEEAGIKLQPDNFEFLAVTNDVFENEKKHYITIFMLATVTENTKAEVMEPHKCEGWTWLPLNGAPKPRFQPLQNLLQGKSQPSRQSSNERNKEALAALKEVFADKI